jgi:predicted nucleotidyltransferase
MPTNMIFKHFEDFTQAQFEPIKSFKLQDELNPEVWEDDNINPEIKDELLELGKDYFEELNLGKVELKDIIFTGSLANYNWSKYSDFDLHLVFDFSDVNEDVDLVRKYLDAVEKSWKLQHDIKIKGYDVEIYCQDSNQEHISTGIYSLENDEWIKKPSKESFEPDEESIRKKASIYMKTINELETAFKSGKTYDELEPKIKKLWKKIKDGRQAGLEKEGEFSIENLVFKLLRRNGYIERFMDLKRKSYDKQYK